MANGTHAALLSNGIQQLKLQQQNHSSPLANTASDTRASSPSSSDYGAEEHDDDNRATNGAVITQRRSSPVREGYGFRPASGTSTPLTESFRAADTGSPLPDPNGLGWPGELTLSARKL